MRRPLTLIGALAVVAAVVAAAAAASTGSVTVTPVARLKFPDRGYLVSLPTRKAASASDVVVLENGRRVSNVSLVPVDQANRRFATLLVIDASDSMGGRPLENAFAAARSFAARLATFQQVGVLTFNSSTALVQRPTNSASELSSSLTSLPSTNFGTHIYDALARALNVLQQAHASASSIVLLSDGADVGSRIHERPIATRAQRMRVRIFTVGLRSSAFQPAPLQTLARDTGGTYAEAASSGQLTSVYDAIAQRLASEYFLHYRSNSNPGANVVVSVKVNGVGAATSGYRVPKIVAIGPYAPSLFVRFWHSSLSLIAIALLGAALAGGVILLLLRRPANPVLQRIGEFATLTSAPEPPSDRKPAFSARLFGGTERSLARTKWWARFKEDLELAEIPYTGEQLLGLAVLGAALLGLVLFLLAPVLSIFGLLVPLTVYSYCQRALRKVRREFEDQLPDNLQVLASALRAGHSFIGALSVVTTDAAEPSKREFGRVVADEQLGIPLEDSLRDVSRRMANRDLEQVALVAELQRQSGGNMAEVLDRVVETIRSRTDLRRLVRTLTAQGRMARWILTSLPVGLGLFLTLANPRYMAPLFRSSGGQVALVVAGLMIITGSYVIKRIVDIKV